MKLIKILLVCVLFLHGCSMLATKEAFVTCQALDIATTARALHLNPLAYESNPFFPLSILYLIKLGLIWYVWQSKTWDTEPEGIRATATVISCAPVPGNLKAAKGN